MKIKINDKDFELPAGLNAAIQTVFDAAMAAERESLSEQKSPFERREIGEEYFAIDGTGDVECYSEDGDAIDDIYYAVANYCTDSALMEQRALHETLNRLLWRYSEEHGGDKQPWDVATKHWTVALYNGKIMPENWWYTRQMGLVCFADKETAEAAIHDVVEPFLAEHPEFVW